MKRAKPRKSTKICVCGHHSCSHRGPHLTCIHCDCNEYIRSAPPLPKIFKSRAKGTKTWDSRYLPTVEDYINSKIVVNENGCWIWGNCKPGRYGGFGYRDLHGSAHIVMHKIYNGSIPEGKIVRHTCDDTRCANPDHLELGTKKDNRRDFMERNPKAMEMCLRAAKIAGQGTKKFWDRMTPEEKVTFCKWRAERQAEKKANKK